MARKDTSRILAAMFPAPVEADPEPEPVSAAYNFNPDPVWQTYVLGYESTIKKVALKYCSSDEALREDVMQEARVAIATVFPEKIHGFEEHKAGEISDEEWEKRRNKYLRNVIRNAILSYLDSYPKGNWYIGRTRSVRDKATGESRKVYLPPRFSSLDELVDDFGMQVDHNGAVSWPDPSDDGLARKRGPVED